MVEPELFQSPRYRGELHITRVALALEAAGISTMRGDPDGGVDLWAFSGSDRFGIILKHWSGPLRPRLIREIRDRYRSIPTVLVTNVVVPSTLQRSIAAEADERFQVVTWKDDSDTPLLLDALISLKSAISRPSCKTEEQTPES